MAKMFYTLEEAIAKLGCDDAAIRQAAREGKLREFRDAGKVNYKVDDVDKLAATGDLKPPSPPPPPTGADDSAGVVGLSASLDALSLSDSSSETPAAPPPAKSGDTDNLMPDLSASGSIGLADTGGISIGGTAVDQISIGGSGTGDSIPGLSGSSGLNLASAGTGDIVSLDEDDAPSKAGNSKEDTVVSSVGVSVFDEEDLDESSDPLAKTVVSGSAAGGTGLEGVGSGSGLLDLTREADDTSLGAELLDEIYPGSDDSSAGTGTGTGTGAAMEMGDATRAGLAGAISDDEAKPADEAFEAPTQAKSKTKAVSSPPVARATVDSAGDVFCYGASGLVVVALLVMCFAGLTIASMIHGIWPSPLAFVYAKLWMFGLGSLVVAGAAMAAGVFLGKRSEA